MEQNALIQQRKRFFGLLALQGSLVVVLLIVGFIISLTIVQIRRDEEQFLTYRVRLNDVNIDTITLESDVRAYILTESAIFANRYDAGVKAIEANYKTLMEHPVFPQYIVPIQTDFERWKSTVDAQIIPAVQNKQIEQADTLMQQQTPLITSVIDRLESLRTLLRNNAAQANARVDLLNWVQLGNIGLLTSLLLISIVTTIRSWRREFRLIDNLHETSAQLLLTNAELEETSHAQQESNERLESRIEESRLITMISDFLATNIRSADAYPTIAQHVARLLDGWCSIALRRPAPEDTLMDIVGLYHPDETKLQALREFLNNQPISINEGLHSGLFVNQDEVVLLQVPREISHPDTMEPEVAPIADLINLTSYIAVPIMVKNDIVGIISVASSTDDYYFESSQVLFLTQIADRIGTWIENNRLFFLAEKRAKELQISFDSMSDLIVAYDAAGHIIRMNKAARDFWGAAGFDAFSSHTVWRTAKGTTIGDDEHPLKVALAGTSVSDVEVQLTDTEGLTVVHTVSISPIIISDEVIAGAVLVARDITARKELDRLKEELVANMSHELRTPLTAILGYSELLLKRRVTSLTPWHINKIEGIRTGGQRLLTLVNDVLDLAKLDAGRVELHRYAVDLNELLRTQADLLTPVFAERKQKLVFNLAAEKPVAVIDPDRIGQIVMNLLSNASKFTLESGSITLHSARLRVSTDGNATLDPPSFPTVPPVVNAGDYVLVAIQDTGVGIAPDMLDRLWDRFYQVEGGSTRRFGGTGLGLAIVQQLIELHQGQVWVHSDGEGQGSIFAFLLPSGDLATDTIPAINANDRSILIIESHSDDALRIERELSEVGFDADVVATGAAAVEWLQTNTPVAIMLNPSLSDMSNEQISAVLRSMPSIQDVPIIITSDVVPVQHVDLLNIATYLIKPFTTETLLRTIHEFVSSAVQREGYILVVDDDVEMASLLAQTLQEHGYNTRSAYDGSAALSLLQTDTIPSLILLDLMMPIIDGFRFLRWIRQHDATRHIPVIIITARDLTNAELRQLRKDSQAVQMKHTLNMDALISEVQRYVPLKETEDD